MTEAVESRDRAICKLLGTNASDLEELLNKSRQTIAKHMDEGKLFGVSEVVKVAKARIPNEIERTRLISVILNRFFPDLVRYTQARDTDVTRFSQYCIFGMYIHAEIVANSIFERLITDILSDEKKFVLFVCLPQKEYVQLSRWLARYQEERAGKTASFAVLPCKLVELAPIQILAEPWSEEPHLIQFNRDLAFVDEANGKRAVQLASTLREYGLSQDRCGAIQDEDVAGRLVQDINNSYFGGDDTPAEKPFVYVNPAADPSRGTIGT